MLVISRVSKHNSRILTKILQTEQLENKSPDRGRPTMNRGHMEGLKLGSNINNTITTSRLRWTTLRETLSFFPDQKKEKISALISEMTQGGGHMTDPRYQRPERAKALIMRASP